MTTQAVSLARAPVAKKSKSLWDDAFHRIIADKFAVFSFFVILFYVLLSLAVKFEVVATSWQDEIGPSKALPVWGTDWRYWLGLDLFGRSILAKVIQGTYTAMYVGLMTSLISIPIGVVLGALAGYFGGWIDDFITWIYTMISNIPDFLLLVAIAFALGKGIFAVNIALGMTTWVSLARLIRGEFMKHKNRDYVVAATALGAGHGRRIFLHILPNVMHIIVISFSLRFVTAIKSEVVLTYLGLGAQSGSASWGLIIEESKGELTQGVWWGLAGTTFAMFLICLAFSMFSDALRDSFDPKIRS
jgi:ABC-type dipeptide/oligopeptide/nickel transport system permease subunit